MTWKRGLGVAGGILGIVALAAGAGVALVVGGASAALGATYTAHEADFPIPFPLSPAEIEALRAELSVAAPAEVADAAPTGMDAPTLSADPPPTDPLAGVDVSLVANQRAVARGKHLVEAVYGCVECHGADFGGGVMIDDPMIGKVLGSNLTSGQGSRTAAYTAVDWDRMVRHGIKPGGRPTIMPSEDYLGMSDRELSDIVAYIRSLPPVDRESPEVAFGPLGQLLLATGQIQLSAQKIPDHQAVHALEPPPTAPDATFGAHLLRACSGCHGASYRGGPIPGAPPDWPAASDLTRADGAKSWTLEEFDRAMRQAARPDGTPLRPPMANVARLARNLTDTEMQALYAAVKALPAP
jgi:mono/diheme cytochrome c family protein